MNEILNIAGKELGISGIAGDQHNERILQYARETGINWINDDETPWCSVFMNWVAHQAGYSRSNSAAARSWLNVGLPIESPEPGDIVVYWREARASHKGHVGIYTGVSLNGSRIYTLGGNQSNSVSISAYPKERLLGFRRLIKLKNVDLPDLVLQIGDRGREVALLQSALKTLGYNIGTSDGIFGAMTEAGVKQFQSAFHDLDITGIFDHKTRHRLEETLRQ